MMVKDIWGMKNFSASRLELSLCCSRWEKFKCRCHCRHYLCEDWIKGKLICYIIITRNYMVKGSVLRPHLLKFWIPLKVIISQALCVPNLAFDFLHCENILPNSWLVLPWLWPGSLPLMFLLQFWKCSPRYACFSLIKEIKFSFY